MSDDAVRVLVADDDASVRDALADLIVTAPDLRLVAVAADHAETVRLTSRWRPDVVLLDVRMPEGSGSETVHAIRRRSPGTAVVALSAYEDRESVLAMLASGVAGYQVKGASDEELLEAVRRARRGQLSMPVDLLARSFRGVLRDRDGGPDDRSRRRPQAEQFHALLDQAPLAVLLVSADNRIRLANREADRIFRRAVSDMIGQPAFILLAKPFRSDFLTRLALARDAESAGQAVGVAAIRGDGTEFSAAVDLRLVHLGEEALVAVFLRHRGDLDETEARYQQPSELSADSLLVIDDEGIIQLLDAQTEEVFGYRRDELLGRPLGVLLPGRELAVYLQQWTSDSERRPEGGRPGLAVDARRRDGTAFPADVALSALDDGDRHLVVVVIRDMSEQRRYERVLEQSFHVLQDMDRDHKLLLNHLVRAQEEERMRIAAGIHDDTLQAITAASLRLQQMRRRLHRPADVELLARLEETIQLSISRLRHLTFDLQTPASEGGLDASINGSLEQLQADTGIDVHIDNTCRIELSPETVVIAYRITQEALNNVRKHARADTVHVRLRSIDDGCLVTVVDDGVGYDPGVTESKPGHLGLTLMQERAQIAGGWCRIESEPGAGTTVEFWLPRDGDLVHGEQRRQSALGLRP